MGRADNAAPPRGAEIPRNAKACPACSSDEKTGWSETAHASNLGLPDEEFNYDEFVKEEFGARQAKPHGINWFWWVTALLLALLLGVLFFH